MKYRINEIFYSIQGEGYWTGTPVVFVRFSGCNLKCPWCDTKYHNEGKEYTKDELELEVWKVAEGRDLPIIITGGEPTLQLTDEVLFRKHHFRAIETNGLLPIPDWIDWVTCSPKTDINFMTESKLPNEIKVVFEKDRIEYIKSLENLLTNLYIQPLEIDGEMNIKECLEFLKDHPRFKLSIQLHKLIGVK